MRWYIINIDIALPPTIIQIQAVNYRENMQASGKMKQRPVVSCYAAFFSCDCKKQV